MGIDISVEPEIEVELRIDILRRIGEEFCVTFKLGNVAQETVSDAIQSELLEEVAILFVDSEGVDRGIVFLSFDWEKYHAALSDDTQARIFKIDPYRNVTEQISPIVALYFSMYENKSRDHNITHRAVIFSWRTSAVGHSTVLENIRRQHGLKKVSSTLEKRLVEVRRKTKQVCDNARTPEICTGGYFDKPTND